MTAHAKLSPSSASTWMTCAGSVAAQEGLPDETSQFAAEGTFAHQISEECLAFGLDPYDFIGHRLTIDGFTFEWTDEDADFLAYGIDQIRSMPGRFYGEHQVDLSHWLGPDQFGTLDRAVVSKDLICICDLKYGRGLPVSPVRNKQLQLYALGFWHQHCRETHANPNTEFLIIVDQPRCSGGGGEWHTTLRDLLTFGEQARAAAERTRDPNAPRTASEDGCRFCKRRVAPGGCDTFNAFMLDVLGMQFDDLDAVEPPVLESDLTPERRAYVLRHRKLFETWLDTLHAQALDDALRGNPCGGLKAVDGRKSPDKWFDPVAADEALIPLLGDERLTKKVKTPTQVVKLLGKERAAAIEDLIKRGEKSKVLVSEEDARPAVNFTALFDEL